MQEDDGDGEGEGDRGRATVQDISIPPTLRYLSSTSTTSDSLAESPITPPDVYPTAAEQYGQVIHNVLTRTGIHKVVNPSDLAVIEQAAARVSSIVAKQYLGVDTGQQVPDADEPVDADTGAAVASAGAGASVTAGTQFAIRLTPFKTAGTRKPSCDTAPDTSSLPHVLHRSSLYWGESSVDESLMVEFKQKRPNMADIRKYATSFLNSSGGSLFFGVHDAGFVMGIPLTQQERQDLTARVTSWFKSQGVPPSHYTVACIPVVPLPGVQANAKVIVHPLDVGAVFAVTVTVDLLRRPLHCYENDDEPGTWFVRYPAAVLQLSTPEDMMAWCTERFRLASSVALHPVKLESLQPVPHPAAWGSGNGPRHVPVGRTPDVGVASYLGGLQAQPRRHTHNHAAFAAPTFDSSSSTATSPSSAAPVSRTVTLTTTSNTTPASAAQSPSQSPSLSLSPSSRASTPWSALSSPALSGPTHGAASSPLAAAAAAEVASARDDAAGVHGWHEVAPGRWTWLGSSPTTSDEEEDGSREALPVEEPTASQRALTEALAQVQHQVHMHAARVVGSSSVSTKP